ncbi:MAG: 3' terminal RNA ribose 2'-O-methyltransferase Hen1 [Myxococcota bacterium]
MLLTLSTSHAPATDLGFLLGKHPERYQTASLAFGEAHVFFPEASEERCTAALLVEVDPVRLVRGGSRGLLEHYVNDRPYATSSFLSVALAKVFRSGLNGSSRDRPELVDQALPFSMRLATVSARGGEKIIRELFEPLGYDVGIEAIPLDPSFPDWGDSRYFRVELEVEARLREVLTHLYVLLPVLDGRKHYFVGEEEIAKLVEKGQDWLPRHPSRELIVGRYLERRKALVREALAQLVVEEGTDPDEADQARDAAEAEIETPLRLADQRTGTVLAVLREAKARRVLDLGCGDGRLLRALLDDSSFEDILGMDVSARALEIAARRLKLDRMPERKRARIRLIQGSLTYRDARLSGFDAACLVEVIEHIDPPRLATVERALFAEARPRMVIVTTPNVEYNVRFANLAAGRLRHGDHRFEWSRAEMESWARRVADEHGYRLRILPVGAVDPEVGAPTQMGVFER